MAKDMVRIRKHQQKFTGLVANLRAVSLQVRMGKLVTESYIVLTQCSFSRTFKAIQHPLVVDVAFVHEETYWFAYCILM